MSAQVPSAILQEIKSRTNLVELIGRYVELKRAGRTHKGLCPFHKDSAPSFTVSEEMGSYHCFGCQAHGDAFSFLMAVENLSFFEAVKQLAEAAGVELPERREPTAAERRVLSERDAVLELNAAAMAYFEKQLIGPAGTEARAYIAKRGLTPEMVRRFRLGYAPDGWNGLRDALEAQGHLRAAQEKAGLVIQGPRSHYDRFRHRLMFPIIMQHDHVIGFGGRILDARDEAKYINTPESPVYVKSQALYGYHAARQAVARADRAIVVEGNVDVITMHQFGFEETLATCGTALTEAHLRFLKRLTSNIVILYDGDAAGKKAMFGALERFLKFSINARAVMLPDNHDPDTFLHQVGAEAMRERLSQARYLFDIWLEEQYLGRMDGPKGASDCLHRVVPMLAKIADATERDLYIQRISESLSVREQVVRQALRRHTTQQNWEKGPTEAGPRAVRGPEESAFRAVDATLFELVVFHHESLGTRPERDRVAERLESPLLREVLARVLAARAEGRELTPDEMLEAATDGDGKNRLARLLFTRVPFAADKVESAYVEAWVRLALTDLERELDKLEAQMRQAAAGDDRARLGELTLAKLSLLKRRDALRRELSA